MEARRPKGFPSYFYAYQTGGGQLVPNNVLTKVTLDGELEDSLAEFDSVVNYRFSPRRLGIYLLNAQVGFLHPAVGFSALVEIISAIDGVLVESTSYVVTANWSRTQATTMRRLDAGDTLDLWVLQVSGAPRVIATLPRRTFFQGQRVR